MVASHKKLFTFFQRDGVDNSSYHREFIALVETIETYGGHGAIGITPTFVAQKLQEMHAAGTCTDVASPTKNELAAAHLSVREEFLAALILSGANKDRYGTLRNELANQYTFGSDLYPKMTDQCLTMMIVALIASLVNLAALLANLLPSSTSRKMTKRLFLPRVRTRTRHQKGNKKPNPLPRALLLLGQSLVVPNTEW